MGVVEVGGVVGREARSDGRFRSHDECERRVRTGAGSVQKIFPFRLTHSFAVGMITGCRIFSTEQTGKPLFDNRIG